MSEDCHDSNNKHVRDWAPQRAANVKSFAQVKRLLSGIKHGDVTGDAALAEQLSSGLRPVGVRPPPGTNQIFHIFLGHLRPGSG